MWVWNVCELTQGRPLSTFSRLLVWYMILEISFVESSILSTLFCTHPSPYHPSSCLREYVFLFTSRWVFFCAWYFTRILPYLFFNLLSFFGLAPFLIGSWSWRDSEVILSISYLPFFILFAHMYVCKWSWWGKAWSFFRVRVCKSESRELFRGRYLSEDRGRSERG